MTQSSRSTTVLVLSLIIASCGAEAGEAGSSSADVMVPLEAQAAGPVLSDHRWRLTVIDMSDGDDVEPTVERAPNVVFSEEASPTGSRLMSGSTGCNNFNAAYDAGRGGRLVISSAAMTRMACTEDVMRVEQVFVISLESARTYVIDEDGLTIDFGGGVLRFVADDASAGG